MTSPVVVLLDVGGVLLLPIADHIATGLLDWGAKPAGHNDAHVHYAAVASFDRTGCMHDYRLRYAEMLGVPSELCDDAARSKAFDGPWRRVVPGSAAALRRLASQHPVVIVSDSDGTVADQLRQAELAQVGPGDGVEVRGILDSTHVGAQKPHPRLFQLALHMLGAFPEQAVMIGDSVRCDMLGAMGLGIRALHVTPPGGCFDPRHDDVADLTAATALLTSHA